MSTFHSFVLQLSSHIPLVMGINRPVANIHCLCMDSNPGLHNAKRMTYQCAISHCNVTSVLIGLNPKKSNIIMLGRYHLNTKQLTLRIQMYPVFRCSVFRSSRTKSFCRSPTVGQRRQIFAGRALHRLGLLRQIPPALGRKNRKIFGNFSGTRSGCVPVGLGCRQPALRVRLG